MKQTTIGIMQMGTGFFRLYMKQKYVHALRRHGAKVIWLEAPEDYRDSVIAASEYQRKCDALLLPGGGDLESSIYGQERIPACGEPNPVRDSFEPILFQEFYQARKPILGICRGIQVMNVARGGTLIQDIKQLQAYQHSDFPNRATSSHPITLVTNTLLSHVLSSDFNAVQSVSSNTILVNSMHHQVVDKLGEGFIANAFSPDGFIEGIELKEYPFCIGVQWHPEHMIHDRLQKQLFSAFVAAAGNNIAAKGAL